MNDSTTAPTTSTPPDTTDATTQPVTSPQPGDQHWYVAIGIPGSIDFNIMALCDNRADAAEAAAREIKTYAEIGMTPFNLPTAEPDAPNPNQYDPEHPDFWNDDDLWNTLDPLQMLIYVALDSGTVAGYVELSAVEVGSELYDNSVKGDW